LEGNSRVQFGGVIPTWTGDEHNSCLMYLRCFVYIIIMRNLCLLSAVFVVLLLSSFWLNSEQEVRLNLCCTLLVCHVLFLQNIGHINNGDNAPVIGMLLLPFVELCFFVVSLVSDHINSMKLSRS
jgi:hypothetical protein